MFSLSPRNLKLLSVAFFWIALGATICGASYALYRITTPIAGTSYTTPQVILRALVPFIVAALCGVASKLLYTAQPDDNYLADMTRSPEPPHDMEPAVADEHAETSPQPEPPTPQEPLAPHEPPEQQETEEDDDEEFIIDDTMLAVRKQKALTPRDQKSPLVQRVQRVILQSYKDKAVFMSKESKYPEDDPDAIDPVEIVVASSRAGGFTDDKLVEKVFASVTKSIPKGKVLWSMTEKIDEDRLVFSKKKPFPKMVFPDLPDHVVTSTDEAFDDYEKMRFTVGVDAFGNKIQINPKKSPHGLVVGGTGSGKSVFTLGLIEDLRARGWEIVIVDGKRTDYISLIKENNVVAVGSKIEDWVRIAQFVEEQMDARYELSKRRQKQGIEPRFPAPPMLFLLDEFGSVVREIKGRYGKPGLDVFNNMLKNIAAKARQAKIHMVIATQDVYKNTFDGDLKANLSFIVSLGQASTRTLSDSFSNETRPKAIRIGQSIQEEDKGRGIIEIGTDEGKSVVEFQTYYAYSPGMPPETSGPAAKPWAEYKEKVSDNIPVLYDRMWYEEPEPDELAALDDIEVLKNYPFVPLSKKGKPIESRRVYDVLDDDYIGNRVTSTATVIGFDDDEDDAADYPDDPATRGMVDEDSQEWLESQIGKMDAATHTPGSSHFTMIDLDAEEDTDEQK